jgi:hypothetical protein
VRSQGRSRSKRSSPSGNHEHSLLAEVGQSRPSEPPLPMIPLIDGPAKCRERCGDDTSRPDQRPPAPGVRKRPDPDAAPDAPRTRRRRRPGCGPGRMIGRLVRRCAGSRTGWHAGRAFRARHTPRRRAHEGASGRRRPVLVARRIDHAEPQAAHRGAPAAPLRGHGGGGHPVGGHRAMGPPRTNERVCPVEHQDLAIHTAPDPRRCSGGRPPGHEPGHGPTWEGPARRTLAQPSPGEAGDERSSPASPGRADGVALGPG